MLTRARAQTAGLGQLRKRSGLTGTTIGGSGISPGWRGIGGATARRSKGQCPARDLEVARVLLMPARAPRHPASGTLSSEVRNELWRTIPIVQRGRGDAPGQAPEPKSLDGAAERQALARFPSGFVAPLVPGASPRLTDENAEECEQLV